MNRSDTPAAQDVRAEILGSTDAARHLRERQRHLSKGAMALLAEIRANENGSGGIGEGNPNKSPRHGLGFGFARRLFPRAIGGERDGA
jgi:hypothetical protein